MLLVQSINSNVQGILFGFVRCLHLIFMISKYMRTIFAWLERVYITCLYKCLPSFWQQYLHSLFFIVSLLPFPHIGWIWLYPLAKYGIFHSIYNNENRLFVVEVFVNFTKTITNMWTCKIFLSYLLTFCVTRSKMFNTVMKSPASLVAFLLLVKLCSIQLESNV